MASSCCFQHLTCFLCSFHNHHKNAVLLAQCQSTQGDNNYCPRQKSSSFTYWTFLSFAFGCSESAGTSNRSSTQAVSVAFVTQVVPMEILYFIGKSGGGSKMCNLSITQGTQMSLRPSHRGLDLSPGCDLPLCCSRNFVSVDLVSSWSWENPG